MTPPPRVEAVSIYLIWHGETEWSASGRHTGRSDLVLTAARAAEARALRPVVADILLDNVITSPALRARRTCELAGLEEDAVIDPVLADYYGECESERSTTIRETRPDWTVYRDGRLAGNRQAIRAGVPTA